MKLGKLLLIALVALTPTLASAKSAYVVASINANPTPIHAYLIDGGPSYLSFQSETDIPNLAGGAVGLAIDGNNAKLFVTYEFSNTIQLLDAITFADLGTTSAPGASNLAGITYDANSSRVYTVDRNTNNLYVYDWNSATNTLTLVNGGGPSGEFDLAAVGNAYGLALDETRDRLYVADASSTTVRYFETTGFTETGNVSLTLHSPAGIAVDQVRNLLYTGARPVGGTLLVKYDLNTSTETSIDIQTTTGGTAGEGVIGVAVDEVTGNVHITTGFSGDRLMVFDSNLGQLQAYTTPQIQGFGGTNWGDPTAIVIPREEITFGDARTIPTLSTWGLILLASLLGGLGVASARGRNTLTSS